MRAHVVDARRRPTIGGFVRNRWTNPPTGPPNVAARGEQTGSPAALTTRRCESDASHTDHRHRRSESVRLQPMVGDILQPTHLLLILVVALLVLGPKRLPEVGRTLGSGLRDFRRRSTARPTTTPRRAPTSKQSQTRWRRSRPTVRRPSRRALICGDRESAEADASELEPATPTALHEHQLDPQAARRRPTRPAAVEDLHPPAATDDLQATDDLHPPAATHDLQTTDELHPPAATDDLQATDDLYPPPATDDEGDAVSVPVATASSSGFASALASSRQRPAATASRQPTTSSDGHAAVVALLRLTDTPHETGRVPTRHRQSC